MTTVPRITLVSLGVHDLAAATRFYEALGFVRRPHSSASITFFDAGGADLALYGWDALADDAGVGPRGKGFRGTTLACNFTSSADVLALLERAVAAGGTLVKPGQPVFWGGFSGYFSDLDGHLWEVACGSEDYAKEQAAQ